MSKLEEEILEEIRASRETNSKEHEKILKSADVSMKLSKSVQDVLDDFNGFRKTLLFVRNIIFTVGALYLIFQDPLHKAFNQ